MFLEPPIRSLNCGHYGNQGTGGNRKKYHKRGIGFLFFPVLPAFPNTQNWLSDLIRNYPAAGQQHKNRLTCQLNNSSLGLNIKSLKNCLLNKRLDWKMWLVPALSDHRFLALSSTPFTYKTKSYWTRPIITTAGRRIRGTFGFHLVFQGRWLQRPKPKLMSFQRPLTGGVVPSRTLGGKTKTKNKDERKQRNKRKQKEKGKKIIW